MFKNKYIFINLYLRCMYALFKTEQNFRSYYKV